MIGDRGTDSELLRNHKSLMFMKNLSLMAFPVTLCEKSNEAMEHENGQFSYQGAYVYNISSNEGFKLRGRITHLDDKNTAFIDRIIYSNELLYTFSGEKLKLHDTVT